MAWFLLLSYFFCDIFKEKTIGNILYLDRFCVSVCVNTCVCAQMLFEWWMAGGFHHFVNYYPIPLLKYLVPFTVTSVAFQLHPFFFLPSSLNCLFFFCSFVSPPLVSLGLHTLYLLLFHFSNSYFSSVTLAIKLINGVLNFSYCFYCRFSNSSSVYSFKLSGKILYPVF